MSDDIDLTRARRETPGVQHVVHLNNCGAGLMPTPVLDAVTGHLRLEAEFGGYEAHARRELEVEAGYDSIARLLNCNSDEIAVVENATVGWDMAFYALAFRPGDRIVTGSSEYGSNYIAYLQVARRTGAEIVVAPDDEHGQIDVDGLEALLDERVKLISITHAPTSGGLVNPAAEIGRVARARGIPYILDACQSVGQMPLDVEEIGCDVLSATSRKFLRGPRGMGFVYIRRALLERLEPPFLDNHAATWTGRDTFEIRPDARRFENWENYVAGKIGLAVAVDYALSWGLEAIRARVDRLANDIRARLEALPGVAVHDLGRVKSGIVGFTVGDLDPMAVKARLAEDGINITTSGRASTRIDMERRGLSLINRLGVHYYNSDEEVDRFIEAIETLARA